MSVYSDWDGTRCRNGADDRSPSIGDTCGLGLVAAMMRVGEQLNIRLSGLKGWEQHIMDCFGS